MIDEITLLRGSYCWQRETVSKYCFFLFRTSSLHITSLGIA